MKKGKAIVLGTAAGLAIGAIAGILTAPRKGSKTRRIIMDKGDNYMNKVKLENAKKEAEDLAQKGKAKYDNFRKEVKNAASDFNHTTV